MRYNQGGEVIEIVIRDSSGAKIENYKFQLRDKRAGDILRTLTNKYGIGKKPTDIDWLKD